MNWANAYIGIPFVDLGRSASGCDCWGLVTLVYQQELGITLPSYTGAYACADEITQISMLIGQARLKSPWQKHDKIQPLDVLLFRRGALTCHVGIAVDARRFLHIDCDQAKIAQIADPRWSRRLVAAYGHQDAGGDNHA